MTFIILLVNYGIVTHRFYCILYLLFCQPVCRYAHRLCFLMYSNAPHFFQPDAALRVLGQFCLELGTGSIGCSFGCSFSAPASGLHLG